jgi:hypothetical protein
MSRSLRILALVALTCISTTALAQPEHNVTGFPGTPFTQGGQIAANVRTFGGLDRGDVGSRFTITEPMILRLNGINGGADDPTWSNHNFRLNLYRANGGVAATDLFANNLHGNYKNVPLAINGAVTPFATSLQGIQGYYIPFGYEWTIQPGEYVLNVSDTTALGFYLFESSKPGYGSDIYTWFVDPGMWFELDDDPVPGYPYTTGTMGIDYELRPVPSPSAVAVLLGTGGFMSVRRRRCR